MADQEMLDSLAEAVGGVLEAECPVDDVLKFARNGGDLHDRLKAQAIELGWLGIAGPEVAGGGEMGLAALVPIYVALGRHLAPLPFLGQQLCIDALAASGLVDDGRLPALLAGNAWGTAEISLSFEAALIRPDDRIVGEALPLFDDGESRHLLLFAREVDGTPVTLMLDIAAAKRNELPMHDLTRPMRRVAIDGIAVADSRIASGDAAIALQARILDHQSLALAADCEGGARSALARTVEYLKTREQFGRPIGTFQALKHRAASMKLDVETGAALLRAAIEAFDGGGKQASALASLAKARGCTGYVRLAGEAIQLHGGIGFTSESPVHLHLKRAKLSQALGQGDHAALDRAAALLVGEAA